MTAFAAFARTNGLRLVDWSARRVEPEAVALEASSRHPSSLRLGGGTRFFQCVADEPGLEGLRAALEPHRDRRLADLWRFDDVSLSIDAFPKMGGGHDVPLSLVAAHPGAAVAEPRPMDGLDPPFLVLDGQPGWRSLAAVVAAVGVLARPGGRGDEAWRCASHAELTPATRWRPARFDLLSAGPGLTHLSDVAGPSAIASLWETAVLDLAAARWRPTSSEGPERVRRFVFTLRSEGGPAALAAARRIPAATASAKATLASFLASVGTPPGLAERVAAAAGADA